MRSAFNQTHARYTFTTYPFNTALVTLTHTSSHVPHMIHKTLKLWGVIMHSPSQRCIQAGLKVFPKMTPCYYMEIKWYETTQQSETNVHFNMLKKKFLTRDDFIFSFMTILMQYNAARSDASKWLWAYYLFHTRKMITKVSVWGWVGCVWGVCGGVGWCVCMLNLGNVTLFWLEWTILKCIWSADGFITKK